MNLTLKLLCFFFNLNSKTLTKVTFTNTLAFQRVILFYICLGFPILFSHLNILSIYYLSTDNKKVVILILSFLAIFIVEEVL